MKASNTIKQFSWVIFLFVFADVASASGDHEPHGHEESTEVGGHQDEHEKRVTIASQIAKKSYLLTSTVAPGKISKQLKIYGKTVNDPSQVSHIRARFPGTIDSVNVNIGDTIKAGDILAYIESNESLKNYPVKAKMSGVVLARHANPGESALNQVLFTLADFDQIWLELQVFPGHLMQVKAGQKVIVSGIKETVESTIQHVIPTQEGKPYSYARVLLNNNSQDWTTGLVVSAQVVINEFETKMVVKQQAIQSIENQSVVFIKEGESYTAHSVELGQSDGRYTEILSGVKLGDEYVSENSYLIKADIEKSGASHDH